MESYPNTRTESYRTLVRCVNLDWLEVHAYEPTVAPRNAFYFRACGFVVHERDYGTRVYREMFTLEGLDGEELLEIRRNPASQGIGGIHQAEECHIRLKNRTCYFDNAAILLQDFLSAHGYYDVRISRIDICLDFTAFDRGDDPQAFVRRYFKHKYAKINQGNIAGYGSDTWTGQEWNSLAWGSKSSAVTTKLYNKTLELHDVKLDRFSKPYIREAWFRCGFIDDIQRVTKEGEKVIVWRVEFSLRSAVKNWVPIEIDGKEKNFQSLRNTLDVYSSRDKILVMFASLANHYFHFKKFKKSQRKDRCPDKVLFDFSSFELTYKIGRPDTALGSGNAFLDRYQRLIAKIRDYQNCHYGAELHKACEVLISSMTEETMRSDLANPWSPEELLTLKELLRLRTHDKSMTYEAAMTEIKKLLNITDRTINKF